MSNFQYSLIFGFAIFSMFFGSGNLVFPLQIGQAAQSQWFFGFLGLFITGIILPFSGLFVIKLHRGSYNSFFGEAGKLAKIILPFFTLSLLGAFGVVPRCITVAHGGISYIFPQIPLVGFSFFFCSLCFIFCLKDNFMIHVLGKWLTPVLLLSLAILILLGVWFAPALAVQKSCPVKAFKEGFLVGYQTMDLFAAFFFSALIFQQIQSILPKSSTQREVIKQALKPSLIGAILLSLVYLGFVYLGAHYHSISSTSSLELILPSIATHVLGERATFLIAIIVIFSCLTTAVALNNIYARYLCSLFQFPSTMFPFVLFFATLISFLFSLLDFHGIAAFLSPILEITYPSLIFLTISSIFLKDARTFKITGFYAILGMFIIFKYVSI